MRLHEDMEIVCYSPTHKIKAFAVGLPALILWGKVFKLFETFLGIGIPSFGLRLIVSLKKELNKFEVKSKYGFLYSGYN